MKKFFKAALVCLLCLGMVLGFSSCGKKLIGFDTELAQAVGEKLGVEVEFKKIDWDTKVTLLDSGYVDCVWNGMTITSELEEQIAFSMPYMSNKQVAVIRKADANTYKDKDSIVSANAKLVAEEGSAGATIMEDDFPSTMTKKGAVDQMGALLEVSSNAYDVAFVDSVLGSYLLKTDNNYSKNLVIVGSLEFEPESYGIGFQKENLRTLVKINEALFALQEDGTINKIAEKYGLKDVLKTLALPEYDFDENDAKYEAGWNKIVSAKKIVVGVTYYAPICFFE